MEIGEQACDGLVDGAAVGAHGVVEVEMVIPISVADFHEAHAGLDHATGHETFAAEVGGGGGIDAVEFFGGIGFLVGIDDERHLALHFKGQFVTLDHALHLRIHAILVEFLLVEILNEIQLRALRLSIHGWLKIAQLGTFDGAVVGADAGALVDGGKKGTAVVLSSAESIGRGDGDESRKVFIGGAQTIERPGTEGRPHEL